MITLKILYNRQPAFATSENRTYFIGKYLGGRLMNFLCISKNKGVLQTQHAQIFFT